jgi:hypothetical protein
VPLVTHCPHCGRDTETTSENVCVECFRDKAKAASPSNYHPPKRSPDDYTREVVANEVGRFGSCCLAGCLPFALLAGVGGAVALRSRR